MVEINNELRELEYAERRVEVVRILTEVYRSDPSRRGADRRFGRLPGRDRHAARQGPLGLGERVRAADPLDGRQAGAEKRPPPAVAADAAGCGARDRAAGLQLDRRKRILVISGPNAGGKSVCLKTTGIVQYMFQCGFPVPVSEVSELPVFESIFIDIGDEQSIDNDLSTYSSHLLEHEDMLAGAFAARWC